MTATEQYRWRESESRALVFEASADGVEWRELGRVVRISIGWKWETARRTAPIAVDDPGVAQRRLVAWLRKHGHMPSCMGADLHAALGVTP